MRRFRCEDNRVLDPKPDMYVTLHKGPYMKKNVLHKTGWKIKNCTITEISRDDDAVMVGPQRDEDGDLIVG
jgi:hypothetical protein